MTLDAEEYERRFGMQPMNDDLDRTNCPDAGKPGHFLCGTCPTHDRPRFMCGCALLTKERED